MSERHRAIPTQVVALGVALAGVVLFVAWRSHLAPSAPHHAASRRPDVPVSDVHEARRRAVARVLAAADGRPRPTGSAPPTEATSQAPGAPVALPTADVVVANTCDDAIDALVSDAHGTEQSRGHLHPGEARTFPSRRGEAWTLRVLASRAELTKFVAEDAMRVEACRAGGASLR